MRLMEELKIPVLLHTKLNEVCDEEVVVTDLETGKLHNIPANTVLLALGMRSLTDTADALRHSAPETEVYIVGDAITPGNLGPAVKSAFTAAVHI